ncbi:MAG: hypothetical protein L0214_14060 [candidate division NC10 bacterium]|nr:hypothetical protein [candidate division NC10 bacterium]
MRGIAAAIRARRKTFWGVALGVFLLSLFLPVVVLSIARKPVDHFTFNPWLSRLPEYLVSGQDPVAKKVGFLANMALAWFISENPIEGVEWGFIIDVPSLTRFLATSLLFGAYFSLWLYRRDQAQQREWGASAARYGGVAGALTSVLGFTTGACSVMGCGLPVLPVVALALTGLSSGTLGFFSELSRLTSTFVLLAVTVGVAWLGWAMGASPAGEPLPAARLQPPNRLPRSQ